MITILFWKGISNVSRIILVNMYPCITDCQEAKCLNLPNEADVANLTIGTLSPSTSYYIYVWAEGRDKYKRISATSDGAGLLTFDMLPYRRFFNDSDRFILWVTLTTGQITEKETVTISVLTYTCFQLTFIKTFGLETENPYYQLALSNQEIEANV